MSPHSPDLYEIQDLSFKPYIKQSRIHREVERIGKALTMDFQRVNPIFIGVLNGAFVFLSDLIRLVKVKCEMDFWKLSSYGDEKVSSGDVSELKALDANIENRHVILVEDIVDTGLSMNFMLERLQSKNPASITTVALLHKKEAMIHEVEPDYVGFEIPDYFVIGYGLDYAQLGRNLPHIYRNIE